MTATLRNDCRVIVAALFGSVAIGCMGKPVPDPDAVLATATALRHGAWVSDRIACDDREGDCSDWYRLEVSALATLTVETLLDSEDGDPLELNLSLVDAVGLTLIETRSGGRDQVGLRSDVNPGTFHLWVSPTNRRDETRIRYRLKASATATTGRTIPQVIEDKDNRAVCIDIVASESLNFYGGSPHSVVFRIYPLTGDAGFRDASVEDLLRGIDPPGVAGKPVELVLIPGERRTLDQSFPIEVRHLGLLADYYRGPGGTAGARKQLTAASCTSRPSQVHLTADAVELAP